jgi:chromosome segregation ATPase
MGIQRFTFTHGTNGVADPQGDYVLFDDHLTAVLTEKKEVLGAQERARVAEQDRWHAESRLSRLAESRANLSGENAKRKLELQKLNRAVDRKNAKIDRLEFDLRVATNNSHAHFGANLRLRERIDNVEAECESLRKQAALSHVLPEGQHAG